MMRWSVLILSVLCAASVLADISNDADMSKDGVFTPWVSELDDDRLYLDNVKPVSVPFWVSNKQAEYDRIRNYKTHGKQTLDTARRIGESLERFISHTANAADKKMRQFKSELEAVPLTPENAAEYQRLAAAAEEASGSIVRLGEKAAVVGLGDTDPQNTWNIFEEINDEVNRQARRQIFNAGVDYLQRYGKPEKRFPVMLVPGFGGTRLKARLRTNQYGNPCGLGAGKFRSIWLSSRRLFRFMTVPGLENCFYDALSLVWNGNDFVQPAKYRVQRVQGTHGVDLLDPGIASSLSEYFNPLIRALETVGYRRDFDLRAFTYDWRFRPDQPRMTNAFKRLQKDIEEMYEIQKNPVVVVGHAMGAQHFVYFVEHLIGKDAALGRAWVNKYIRSFVSIGGNHGGAPRVLRALISGTRFSQPFFNKRKTGNMFASFGSAAFMLPAANVWGDRPLLIVRHKSGAHRGYSAKRMERLLERGFVNPSVFHYRQVAPYLNEPTQLVADTHVFYGFNVPTPLSYVYERRYRKDGSVKGLRLIATERGSGDGYVPVRSSRYLCKIWQNIRCKGFEKINHRELLWHMPLLTRVLEVSTGLRTATQGLVKPLVNPLSATDTDNKTVASPNGEVAPDLGGPSDVDGIEPIYTSTPNQDAESNGVILYPQTATPAPAA